MVPVPSQELPVHCCIQPRTALGTPAPDFSSGLTPEAFPMSGYGRNAAEVWNQSFPSLRWTVFPDWWTPSTQSTGFQAPGNPPSPLLLSVVAVPPGLLYLSHTSRLGAGHSCQRLLETGAMRGILQTMGACPDCHPSAMTTLESRWFTMFLLM